MSTDEHQARNDAQYATLRRTKPEIWNRLLEQLSDDERQVVTAHADAGDRALEIEALAEELYAEGAYDRAGAWREAEAQLPALRELGEAWDDAAAQAALDRREDELAARCACFATGTEQPACLAAGRPLCDPPRDPFPPAVRDLASRGPATMERRFGAITLPDGSVWWDEQGAITLEVPPTRYNTPELHERIAERYDALDQASAVGEAQLRALWGFTGTADELRQHIARERGEAA